MFRPRTFNALRRLSQLPSGTHVRLDLGVVYVRFVKRWMVAGVVGDPLTPKALLKLNGGHMPTVLVPAPGTRWGASW